MLCYDLEVNELALLEKCGIDGEKVTAAYRQAIYQKLIELMKQGFVSERKAV
jgi:hypothetical protein